MISSLGLLLALPLIPAACMLLATGRARCPSPALPLLIAWYLVDARTLDAAAALGSLAAAAVLAWRWPNVARRALGVIGVGFGALAVFMAVWPRHTWDAAGINPNTAAGVLLLAGPWVDLAGLPLAVGGLLATTSRAAWVGAIVSTLAAWARQSRAGRRAALALAVAAPLVLAGLIAMRPASLGVRLAVWREAVGLFAARPLTGWGAGAYPQISQVRPGKLHPDSLPLAVAVERGGVGLALLGWLLRDLWRDAGPKARLSLLAWGVQCLADCTLFSPLPALALGLVGGLANNCQPGKVGNYAIPKRAIPR